jgi:putative ABC transport system ATP-binding protein
MLELKGVHKSFADGDRRIEILVGLDLRLEAGELMALLGRSGSGKSTLLNCIAGIEPIDAGAILIDGKEMSALAETERTLLRRRKVGIVFQFFELLPTLSAEENVALPALLDGVPRSEALRRARELLERLELSSRRTHYVEQLSGGERQRVATARALVLSPTLLLADEPTGNLDAAAAEQTLALFERIRRDWNVAIFMATHSQQAAKIAQRKARLVDGRLDWLPADTA